MTGKIPKNVNLGNRDRKFCRDSGNSWPSSLRVCLKILLFSLKIRLISGSQIFFPWSRDFGFLGNLWIRDSGFPVFEKKQFPRIWEINQLITMVHSRDFPWILGNFRGNEKTTGKTPGMGIENFVGISGILGLLRLKILWFCLKIKLISVSQILLPRSRDFKCGEICESEIRDFLFLRRKQFPIIREF